MVNDSGRKNGDQRGRVQAIVRSMMSIPKSDHGITLVELLATLIIASILSTVVVITVSYEFKSWQAVVPNSDVRSNVVFTSKALQQVFQNVSSLNADPNYPGGTALVGTDANGNTVEIRLQQPGTDHVMMTGNAPIEGIVVTDTQVNGSKGPTVLPNTTYTFTDTSFAGTTFSVNGSLVTMQIQATYYGSSSPLRYEVTENFALGGGD